jgi:hypothetical protein
MARLDRIHEHEAGITWVIGESMTRSSHALADAGRVWLIDPVDIPEAIDRASSLGAVAGVIQLLDRHERDCAALAERFDVPHLRLPTEIPGAPFEPSIVIDVPKWREVALWWAEPRVLVVAEAVGTNAFFAVGSGPLGVHPMLRLLPPTKLRRFDPQLLLTGHGPPLEGPDTAEALSKALGASRRDIPRLLAKLPRALRP